MKEENHRGVIFKGITSRHCYSKSPPQCKNNPSPPLTCHTRIQNSLFANQDVQNEIGHKIFNNRALKTSMSIRKPVKQRKITIKITDSLGEHKENKKSNIKNLKKQLERVGWIMSKRKRKSGKSLSKHLIQKNCKQTLHLDKKQKKQRVSFEQQENTREFRKNIKINTEGDEITYSQFSWSKMIQSSRNEKRKNNRLVLKSKPIQVRNKFKVFTNLNSQHIDEDLGVMGEKAPVKETIDHFKRKHSLKNVKMQKQISFRGDTTIPFLFEYN